MENDGGRPQHPLLLYPSGRTSWFRRRRARTGHAQIEAQPTDFRTGRTPWRALASPHQPPLFVDRNRSGLLPALPGHARRSRKRRRADRTQPLRTAGTGAPELPDSAAQLVGRADAHPLHAQIPASGIVYREHQPPRRSAARRLRHRPARAFSAAGEHRHGHEGAGQQHAIGGRQPAVCRTPVVTALTCRPQRLAEPALGRGAARISMGAARAE
ncbi:hypothetical protein D3C87_1504220 [compost metagenome]